MYYEINVSFKGSHFFATHERSLQTIDAAMNMFKIFNIKFPKSEGFELELTKWTKCGERITSTK